MKKITATEYAKAFYEAISEAKDQSKVIQNMAEILEVNNDLGLINEIQDEFEKYDREIRGVRQAETISAKPLTKDVEKKIIAQLNEYVQGDVELKKKVDENVIGGVLVRVGDEQIDGTVKRFLKDLKKKIVN